MSEILMVKRAEKWPPREGEWFRTNKSIFIRCGGCGELATLDDHTIGSDGTVNPSVVCPYEDEGCTWHVFVKLEGWDGGELRVVANH